MSFEDLCLEKIKTRPDKVVTKRRNIDFSAQVITQDAFRQKLIDLEREDKEKNEGKERKKLEKKRKQVEREKIKEQKVKIREARKKNKRSAKNKKKERRG